MRRYQQGGFESQHRNVKSSFALDFKVIGKVPCYVSDSKGKMLRIFLVYLP